MANTAPMLAGRAAGPLMLPPCRYLAALDLVVVLNPSVRLSALESLR